ncbi:MAG TPA: DUF3237 domain-containing protein [Nevskia sp.]|jgi:hypothetical protein|nr:DUF3237 domain-containing protein [Nevskia sp.]
MHEYRMEHLFSYNAGLRPPEVIAPLPEGARATFHITGGTIRGRRLNGRLQAAGADWFLLRRDGVGQLDVRATLESDDGALIYASYPGLADFGEDGYERFLRGELPKTVKLRTTPTLRTAHPDYQWLHRLLCVGVGEADLEKLEVSYDVYAVR